MVDFTFRYRFRLASRSFINSDEPQLRLLPPTSDMQLFLVTADDTIPLKFAHDLVLQGSGFASEETAKSAGLKMTDCLAVALVHHRIGARPSSTIPRARFLNSGLAKMKAANGVEVMADDFGLTVFPTNLNLEFASLEATSGVGIQGEQFKSSFGKFATHDLALTNRDRLAVDFFNLSFLQESNSVRLICLVTAIESLIDDQPRHNSTLKLVNSFIEQTRAAPDIPQEEANSLLGSLNYLRKESISRAGAYLARERLGTESFHGKTPDKFFTYCYNLRSKLVHGLLPAPTVEELDKVVPELELFVSDLIRETIS